MPKIEIDPICWACNHYTPNEVDRKKAREDRFRKGQIDAPPGIDGDCSAGFFGKAKPRYTTSQRVCYVLNTFRRPSFKPHKLISQSNK